MSFPPVPKDHHNIFSVDDDNGVDDQSSVNSSKMVTIDKSDHDLENNVGTHRIVMDNIDGTTTTGEQALPRTNSTTKPSNSIVDESTTNEHDQLPSIEEYKATIIGSGGYSGSNTDYNTNNTTTTLWEHVKDDIRHLLRSLWSNQHVKFMVGGIVFALVLLMIIAISVTRNSNNNNKNRNDDTSTTSPTFYTTEQRFTLLLDYILENNWSNEEDIRGTGSEEASTPQLDAIYFLAGMDPLLLPYEYILTTRNHKTPQKPPSSSSSSNNENDTMDHPYYDVSLPEIRDAMLLELKQRYALTVFYYSLDTDEKELQVALHFLTKNKVCQWNQPLASNDMENNVWDITDSSNLPTTQEMNNIDTMMGISTFTILGVICDNDIENNEDNTMVTKLYFPNFHLTGVLPNELSLLTNLRELNLYNNFISGSIPEIYASTLTNLQALVLYKNSMVHETFPTYLSQLKQLQVLNLGYNYFNGTKLPNTLSELNVLRIFNCASCNLIGTFTDALGPLSMIEEIHVSSNEFIGTLSEEVVANWQHLKELDVSSNQLDGSIPRTLFTNKAMLVLDLHNNQFTESILSHDSSESDIPMENVLDFNPNLIVLALQKNDLRGQLDSNVLQHLYHLKYLDISYNQFTGTLPNAIASSKDLHYLYAAENMELTPGTIPTSIGQLNLLMDLSLQNTKRIGTIPLQLVTELRRLVLFDLSMNELTGTIPRDLGENLRNVHTLLLHNNLLNGTIPESFQNLMQLEMFTIHDNVPGIVDGFTSNICTRDQPDTVLTTLLVDCNIFINTTEQTSCPCCFCCNEHPVQIYDSDTGTTTSSTTQNECQIPIFYGGFDPMAEFQYVRQYYQIQNYVDNNTAIFTVNDKVPMIEEDDTNNNNIDGLYDFSPLDAFNQAFLGDAPVFQQPVVSSNDTEPINVDPYFDRYQDMNEELENYFTEDEDYYEQPADATGTMSDYEERYQDIVIQEEIDVWDESLHADTDNNELEGGGDNEDGTE